MNAKVSSIVNGVAVHPANLAAIDRAIGQAGAAQGTTAAQQLVGGTHATTWLVAIAGLGSQGVLRELTIPFPGCCCRDSPVLRTLPPEGPKPLLMRLGGLWPACIEPAAISSLPFARSTR